MRSARAFLGLALASAGGAALVYVVAFGTSLGRRADLAAYGQGLDAEHEQRAYHATSRLLDTIDLTSLILLGSAIVALALLRRRPLHAAAAAVVIAGANLTTQGLKHGVAHIDPFGATQRAFRTGFPSGHATVAMSLALALVLVSPQALRGVAAVAGLAYAAAVGVAVVALGWHYPSDVAAAFLVCTAWTGLAAAGLVHYGNRATPARRLAPPRRTLALAGGAGILLAFAVVLAVLITTRDRVIGFASFHAAFVGASMAIVALGAVLVGGVTALVARVPATAT
jgi:membrane-associated phospholipid phosphatase